MAENQQWTTGVVITAGARPVLTSLDSSRQMVILPIDSDGRGVRLQESLLKLMPFNERLPSQRELSPGFCMRAVATGLRVGFLATFGTGIGPATVQSNLVALLRAIEATPDNPLERIWVPLLGVEGYDLTRETSLTLILDAISLADATQWNERRFVVATNVEIAPDTLAGLRAQIERKRGYDVLDLPGAISRLGVSPQPTALGAIQFAAQQVYRQHSHLDNGRISTRLILFALIPNLADIWAKVTTHEAVGSQVGHYLRGSTERATDEPIRKPVIFSREAADLLRSAAPQGGNVFTLLDLIRALLVQAQREKPNQTSARRLLDELKVSPDTLLRAFDDQLAKTRPQPSSGSEPAPTPPTPIRRDWYTSPFDDLPDIRRDALRSRAEASALARVAALRDTQPPLAIGIFGDWGAGKTSFMEMIHDEVENRWKGGPYHDKVVQIRFNAWHYIETNLWASLVSHIFQELDAALRPDVGEKVDTLYAGFATGRRLEVEAAARVIAAEQALASARAGAEQALTARPDSRHELVSLARDAFKASYENLELDDKATIDAAVAQLGITEGTAAWERAEQAIRQSRSLFTRAELVVFDLRRAWRDHDVNALVWPLAIAGALLIAALFGTAIAKTLSNALGVFSGVGAGLLVIATALAKLPEKVGGVVGLFAQLQRRRDEARQVALAAAERAVASAQTELAQALTAFSAASPLGRLTRFIRDKAADESYARHLGLVAMIRRDFDLLTACLIEVQTTSGNETTPAAEQARIDEAKRILDQMGQDAALKLKPYGRIILYIDDLDRCPAEKVVEVLQAVHLLLAFRLFVVVVAVDYRWIRAALETVYAGQLRPGSSAGSERGAGAADYLEKIFQIPYWVRRLDEHTSSEFILGLIRSGRQVQQNRTGGDRTRSDATSDTVDHKPPVQPGEPVAAQPNSMGAASDPDAPPPSPGREPDPGQPVSGSVQTSSIPKAVQSPIEITSEEEQLIARLAPYAGRTPRQLKRFLNVYRVIKASLGDNPQWRATLALLAIATRAPERLSRLIGLLPGKKTIAELTAALDRSGAAKDGGASSAVLKSLESELTPGDLVLAAPLVARFSFSQQGWPGAPASQPAPGRAAALRQSPPVRAGTAPTT